MPPESPNTAPVADAPIEAVAGRAGILALLILAYAGVAFAAGLPPLRVATALAVSIGLCGGLLVLLQARRSLCVAWAELSAWMGVTFLIVSAWNLLHGGFTALGAFDLLLGLAMVRHGLRLARAARLLPAPH